MTTQVPSLYAVLDPARAPEIYPVMRALAPDNQCLFGNLAPEVSQVSPHVMALPEGGKLLTWWRAAGRGQAWGIACRTAIGLDGLRVHLKKFTRARLPDSSLVLFRFWDPRVLAIFMAHSTAAEQQRFFGPIEAMYGEDEAARTITWRRRADGTAHNSQAAGAFQISDQLWAGFVAADDASFRARLAELVLGDLGRIGLVTRESVAAQIEPLIARAAALGFESEMEIAAYILAVLPVGEERLSRTMNFVSAAFSPHAPASQRAGWLEAAGREALATS